ncbi:TPA: hypothetical protein DCQ44_03435 [Candidatus Taylorbacteria bacterium]|nr:hypothetical protein [Candidatus Taylorbacteria bacterium]
MVSHIPGNEPPESNRVSRRQWRKELRLRARAIYYATGPTKTEQPKPQSSYVNNDPPPPPWTRRQRGKNLVPKIIRNILITLAAGAGLTMALAAGAIAFNFFSKK